MTRAPISHAYDGAIYARLVEPLLRGVHAIVGRYVPPGSRVLEACCGTGGLAFRLADGGCRVVGVDLSPRNIEEANTRARRRRGAAAADDDLRFDVGDVARLEAWPEHSFDVATIVLGLHEMPPDERVPALRELSRVAERVVVTDFAAPMPRNLAGARNRLMELLAGPTHYRAYREYQRRGGLETLVGATGLEVETGRRLDATTLDLRVLRRPAPPPELRRRFV